MQHKDLLVDFYPTANTEFHQGNFQDLCFSRVPSWRQDEVPKRSRLPYVLRYCISVT